MELLINSIMRHGGDRWALKAKVFGGSNVLQSTARSLRDIGAANVEFAQHFLRTERIPIVAAHTLQGAGMHIQFHTHTAKVLLRMLSQRDSEVVERDGARKATSALRKLDTSSITLFNDNGGQI
jgi:chemotaxis protein CheD